MSKNTCLVLSTSTTASEPRSHYMRRSPRAKDTPLPPAATSSPEVRHVTDASEDDHSLGRSLGAVMAHAGMDISRQGNETPGPQTPVGRSKPEPAEHAGEPSAATDWRDDEAKQALHESEQSNRDFEVSLLAQRNRTILLSRLRDSLPSARLALVRTTSFPAFDHPLVTHPNYL